MLGGGVSCLVIATVFGSSLLSATSPRRARTTKENTPLELCVNVRFVYMSRPYVLVNHAVVMSVISLAAQLRNMLRTSPSLGPAFRAGRPGAIRFSRLMLYLNAELC